MKLSLRVNGTDTQADVGVSTLLVEYLRDALELTGTKIGCETSVCGACTVLLDGEAIKSCTMLAVQAEGSSITTIEGLASGDRFRELADAMTAEHALQCGFCTPGVVVSLVALLDTRGDPDREEVLAALDGNICRCTGYNGVLRAVERVAAIRRGERPEPMAGVALADPVVVTDVRAGGVAGADVEVV